MYTSHDSCLYIIHWDGWHSWNFYNYWICSWYMHMHYAPRFCEWGLYYDEDKVISSSRIWSIKRISCVPGCGKLIDKILIVKRAIYGLQTMELWCRDSKCNMDKTKGKHSWSIDQKIVSSSERVFIWQLDLLSWNLRDQN